MKPGREHNHGVPVMHEKNLFIGRIEEMSLLRDEIKSGRRLHVHGPTGTGKSALLRHVLAHWREIDISSVPVYCAQSGTMREILITLSVFLLARFKHLSGTDKYQGPIEIRTPNDVNEENIINLRNIVYHYLQKGDFCVVLDHLENVTPRINSLLTALRGCASIITVSRQSWDLSDYSGVSGRLAYDLWLGPKLRVGNLDKRDAFTLMGFLDRTLHMSVSDKLRLFKDIYEVSRGNPKMIKSIFMKAADPKYLHDGKLNLNLIVIDCRMDEVRMP